MKQSERGSGVVPEIGREKAKKEAQKILAVEVFGDDAAISEAARNNLRNHFEIEKDEDILILALGDSHFKYTANLCKSFVEQPFNKALSVELSTRGMSNQENIKKIGGLLIRYENSLHPNK